MRGTKTLSTGTNHDTACGHNPNIFAGDGASVADEIGAGDEPTTTKTSTKFVLVNNDLYKLEVRVKGSMYTGAEALTANAASLLSGSTGLKRQKADWDLILAFLTVIRQAVFM